MREAVSNVWDAIVYLFKMFLAMGFSLLESGFCISSEYFGKMCVKFSPCDEECELPEVELPEAELPEVKIEK